MNFIKADNSTWAIHCRNVGISIVNANESRTNSPNKYSISLNPILIIFTQKKSTKF